jgi:hypothetical protein
MSGKRYALFEAKSTMNFEADPKTISEFTQAFAGLLLGAIGVWFTWRTMHQDREKKRLELEESKARMDLALNLTVETRTHEVGEHLFIETFVELYNPSRNTWSVPAAYISYRALIDTVNPAKFTGKESFDHLSNCEGLQVTRNRAYLPCSIWYVGPDERVRLSRIDRVDIAFKKRYPVLWVNVEVFGAAGELLDGRPAELSGRGRYRREWLEFVTSLESRDADFVCLGRLSPISESPWRGFRPGDRCIFTDAKDGVKPDEVRSRQFKDLLAPGSMSQWTIDTTVHIGEKESAMAVA